MPVKNEFETLKKDYVKLLRQRIFLQIINRKLHANNINRKKYTSVLWIIVVVLGMLQNTELNKKYRNVLIDYRVA